MSGFSIKHQKSNTIADFTGTVTVGDSSGGTQTALATNLVRPSDWNSAHIFVPDNVFYEPFVMPNTNSTLSAQGVGTWYFDPFFVNGGLAKGQLNLVMADAAGFLNGAVYSTSSGSISRYQTLNTQIALYQQGVSDSFSLMSRIWSKQISMLATWVRAVTATTSNAMTVSNYLTVSVPSQYDSLGGITYATTSQSGTVSAGASSGASTMADSLITGAVAYISGSKMIPVPFDTTIPPGEYYLGMMISSTSSSTGTNYSNGTMFSTQSILGALEFNDRSYKRMGVSVSNTSSCHPAFHGFLATTSTSPVATVRTSDVRNHATAHRRNWFYNQSSY
jgi:hypothetical protein